MVISYLMLAHHPDHFRQPSCHCAARAFSFTSFTSFASLTSSKPFRIRTSKTPLPQLLYNPHLRTPLGSAGNKGLITPLESALTKNSPATPVESALTKRWGVGATLPLGNSSLVTCNRIQVLLFSYTSKLFCTRQKLNPFVFIQIHALCARHRGVGLRATGWSRFRRRGTRAWRGIR